MKIPNTITVPGRGKLVCRIFDNAAAFDRYTVAFNAVKDTLRRRLYYPYLAASENPFHPQGFGQHGESEYFLTGKELGKRVSFESLPGDVQKFILQNI